MAALLDPVDSQVTGVGELLDQAADTQLDSGGERRCRRAVGSNGPPLGESGGGGAHEATRVEDVERAEPLADEMRSGLETGDLAHPATWEEGDALAGREPRDTLGSVARLCVLGQEHEERSTELLVEGCEEQRQGRVGDAGTRRERRRIRGEALALAELGDKGRQCGGSGGQVHDVCRERSPAGLIVGATPSAPREGGCGGTGRRGGGRTRP